MTATITLDGKITLDGTTLAGICYTKTSNRLRMIVCQSVCSKVFAIHFAQNCLRKRLLRIVLRTVCSKSCLLEIVFAKQFAK
jgi:hypothetical protein